jgi:hypothetical protein
VRNAQEVWRYNRALCPTFQLGNFPDSLKNIADAPLASKSQEVNNL